LIGKYPELTRILALLLGIKGIGNSRAIALMGELLLPPDFSHREWVKFAGLDPWPFDSGKSVHKKPAFPRPVTVIFVQPIICRP
jgi:hypothetical protein